MRLVHFDGGNSFSLVEFDDDQIPPYAILSHRWGSDQDEVTFQDMSEGNYRSRPGFTKLVFCGSQASRDGFSHFWIDTCCINKSSSAELSESINSMFKWYNKAAKCYAYLPDVSRERWKAEFKLSSWFTRGWTLQELLSPKEVDFFTIEELNFGTRSSLAQDIHDITGISIQALLGTPLSHFSITERLSWAKGRRTKREEDRAYSLLGIFDVSMSPIYGEGRRKAFVRLQILIRGSSRENVLLASSLVIDDGEDVQANFSLGSLDEVLIKFQHSLGQRERAMLVHFESCVDMADCLKTMCEQTKNGQNLMRSCAKFHHIWAGLDSCFKVMNIFAPLSSESVSMMLSAPFLAFKLGTQHETHLSKFVDLFEKIDETLPDFQEYWSRYSKFTGEDISKANCPTPRNHRLHKVIPKVFAEIVQFSQGFCRIFGTLPEDDPKRDEDVHSSIELYHVQFNAMLRRLRHYRRAFELEVQLGNFHPQKVKDYRPDGDEGSAAAISHGPTQEHKITRCYNEIDDEHLNDILKESSRTGRDLDELMVATETSLLKWIDASDHLQEFTKARNTRLPNTGEYLLKDSIYQNWKLRGVPQDGCISKKDEPDLTQVLVLKGKPGFGKTVLSSLLIEDLQTLSKPPKWTTTNHGHTFFYHFASERRNQCESSDALRAVLAQMVQTYRADKDTIDRVSVLMRTSSADASKANDNEILSAISIILTVYNHNILVFDGIDECGDHAEFLELIRDLCIRTTTRVLLLGRPNVDLPLNFQHQTIHLRCSNSQDIESFLKPRVHGWKQRKYISDETSSEMIVDKLVAHSEGVFLWTRLMAQYLERRALSPNERLEAILEPDEFKGLHGIYTKIINALELGYNKEIAIIQKIFGFIAVSLRTLSVPELQTAVAIVPGKVTDVNSLITDFGDALPVICGALVEVQSDDSVRFVHASFRDFLSTGLSKESIFSLDEGSTNLRCSTICLSYLLYDLPSSPLSRQPGIQDSSQLEASFPFIKYSLLWVDHVVLGFRVNGSYSQARTTEIRHDFYSILANFINSPYTISVWIEIARTFHMIPSLKPFISLYKAGPSETDHLSPFDTGKLAISLLTDLSVDLERLDQEWGYLLDQDPSAIWGPSITAFCKSSFWVTNKFTTISSMLPVEAAGDFQGSSQQRPILIQSQLSSSGKELGIVLVMPPGNYIEAIETAFGPCGTSTNRPLPSLAPQERRKLIQSCSAGWKLRYQRRLVQNEEITLELEVGIPQSQVSHMLDRCLSSKTPHRFPLPVAFSPDLNQLIILSFVLSIRCTAKSTTKEAEYKYMVQSLERARGTGSDANFKRRTTYSMFSPSSKALALVSKPTTYGYSIWENKRIEVWSDVAAPGDWPRYEFRGEVIASRTKNTFSRGASLDPFAFHETDQVLFFKEGNTTTAWRFDEQGPESMTTILNAQGQHSLDFDYRLVLDCFEGSRSYDTHAIQYEAGVGSVDLCKGTDSSPGIPVQSPINEPSAPLHKTYLDNSACGNAYFLEPLHPDYPEPATGNVDLKALIEKASSTTTTLTDCSKLRRDGQTDSSDHHDRTTHPRNIAEQSLPDVSTTISTPIPGFRDDTSISSQNLSLSNHKQPDTHSAIVVHHKPGLHLIKSTTSSQAPTIITNSALTTQKVTHNAPVSAGSQDLIHLPRLRQGEETQISLLPCYETDKWFRMVWNKSTQDSYSVYDYQTPNLPSIIYRKQGTVGSHTSIAQGTLASQRLIAEGSNSGRKRLLDVDDGLEERGGKRQKTGL